MNMDEFLDKIVSYFNYLITNAQQIKSLFCIDQ